nr:IQ motif, EF-hand binding site [Ipomoea batatas]
MESPFYGSYWSRPSRPRYPVYPFQPKPVDEAPKSKTVHIPVHFVRSEPTRADAALKIQKVFRGFLVRKSMNRVMSVAREVDEIERRVSQSETVEVLRRDERERIRVNEMLMSLLFKLDSVRGVDSGVRVCRKAVTRKAIALQERIDAIVNSNQQTAMDNGDSETANKVCDSPDSEQPESVDQTPCIDDSSESELEIAKTADQSDNPAQIDTDGVEKPNDSPVEGGNVEKSELEDDERDETQSMGGFVSEVTNPKAENEKNGSLEIADTSNREDENNRNRELLERMMEENRKMMGLMAQLSERNEAQTRMLEALTQRVEHLEKSIVCDRLRRKKMKKKHTP